MFLAFTLTIHSNLQPGTRTNCKTPVITVISVEIEDFLWPFKQQQGSSNAISWPREESRDDHSNWSKVDRKRQESYDIMSSESCSVVSSSLWSHGLYSPWNSPGQNTGVGSLSLLQGSSQPRSSALQVDSLPAKPQGKPTSRWNIKMDTNELLYQRGTASQT